MITIRLIKDDEVDLLTTAWNWSSDAPLWFRQHQSAEDETLEEFLTDAKNVLMYGIFIDDAITALIRLNPFANKIFSLDLFAKRKTDFKMLCQAGLSMKEYLYDNNIANGYFGWICERNKPIIALYKALGFTHNGLAYYKGQMHGRAAKWIWMEANKY